MTRPEERPEWQALAAHRDELGSTTLRELFAADGNGGSGRFDRFRLEGAGLLLDFSKNHVTERTHELLVALARASGVEGRLEAMFRGEAVNPTEGRAALHTALRNRSDEPVLVGGEDVMPGIREVLTRLGAFATKVRGGDWKGHTGEPMTDIVNIGIGGSDLGPLMAVEALAPFGHERLRCHFVSNVDGAHLASTVKRLNPATTLFVVASKTFTTQETLANAHSARAWFLDSGAGEGDIAKHFVAVSTNAEAVGEFGIDTDNMFGFWDWVGGRYSIWSAIGLPLMLAIGPGRFERFLEGGYAMDCHVRGVPLEESLPVTLALLTVWYTAFRDTRSHLVAPYEQYLHRFPAYLQQLTMESNGKSVHVDGSSVGIPTEPVVWGEPGTNGQHAFFQLVHQGTHVIPTDFILALESLSPVGEHHELLMANCFAQSEALMKGKTRDEVVAEMREAGKDEEAIERLADHRTFPGDRPSNTLLVQRLDPYTLGALIALYEHKVFVEAAIWDINPFDQWGVELGKQLASTVVDEIRSGTTVTSHDSSTNGLINHALRQRNLQAS
mgnify:CR=1 FL=1